MISSSFGGTSGLSRTGATGGAIQNRFCNYGETVATKRKNAGHHFVEHNAKGKEVGAGIHLLTAHLFGRHVGAGAHRSAGLRERFWLTGCRHCRRTRSPVDGRQLRQAKIQNLDVAALGHEDVRRLDVAVNDSLAVCSTECICYLNSPCKHLLKRQRPGGNVMLKGRAFHEFHGNEGLAILLIDFVDGADVGMVQRGRCTGFSAKTFEGLGMPGHICGQKLERDEPGERGVLGFVHDAHASPAQLFDDSVVRDCLADGWAEVRSARRQSGC